MYNGTIPISIVFDFKISSSPESTFQVWTP